MPDSPHIIALTHTTPAQRTSYMNELRDISILTTGKRELTRQSRDKKDNKFLICASEAQADYLITSDKDLLDLKVYKETRIIPPHVFIAFLEIDKLIVKFVD